MEYAIHILSMIWVAVTPSLVSKLVNFPRAMISLVKCHGYQAFLRSSSSIPWTVVRMPAIWYVLEDIVFVAMECEFSKGFGVDMIS